MEIASVLYCLTAINVSVSAAIISLRHDAALFKKLNYNSEVYDCDMARIFGDDALDPSPCLIPDLTSKRHKTDPAESVLITIINSEVH